MNTIRYNNVFRNKVIRNDNVGIPFVGIILIQDE